MAFDGAQLGVAAARRLAELGCCEIEAGLTDTEFDRIEREFGFQFADDHRSFLAEGLPVRHPPEDEQTWGRPWPDWRNSDSHDLREQLSWPVEGLLGSVRNGWWYEPWGNRPPNRDLAVQTARRHLADVPIMVPVFAHRYVPAGRGTFAHPVLSMWGWDTIYYGADLLDYVEREFAEAEWPEEWSAQATVPFWRDLLLYWSSNRNGQSLVDQPATEGLDP